MSKDLTKQLEEQQKQLQIYEKKLKDVVRAYKSLEAEKKALEVAFESLGGNDGTESQSEESASESTSKSEVTEENKIESLKQAISTLTMQNKRKEMAFQADRKALLQKNEELEGQLQKFKSVGDALMLQRQLKERLKQSEMDKEKMLADHGAVLAEMQSRYAKERKNGEAMEKQIAELYKKLQANEENNKKIKLLEKEVGIWKEKAEGTPSIRVLREEIENMKKQHHQEIEALKEKYSRTSNSKDDKDKRIIALEHRVQELTEENVQSIKEKSELLQAIDELEKKLNYLMSESENLKKAQRRLSMEVDESMSLEERLADSYNEIMKLNPRFDVYDCLKLPHPRLSLTPEPSMNQMNNSGSQSALSDPESFHGNCTTCDSAQKDLSYFKNLITHLQKKLKTVENSQESMKNSQDEVIKSLRSRISDLETSQQKTYAQLTEETKRKVIELEEEMTKQRQRMMEIIAEKDKEIELTKNSLSELYAQQQSQNYPADPNPKTPISRRESSNIRKSTDSLRSAMTFHSEDDYVPGPIQRSISTHINESKNIFYEQELMRKEQEIIELRHIIRLSETKIQDIEQASLTKDIQYLQIVETLKEEIRILEGRLTLHKTEVNLEYLRNVFIQLISSKSAVSRKHILKAMGTVLKLTQAEMRKVESWNV